MSDGEQRDARAFFAERAAGWDARFPHDGPAYATAVDGWGLRPGWTVLDAGCGTGRALPALRRAVGASGRVLGADLTAAMLDAAVHAGRDAEADLVVADVHGLPLAAGTVDAVFAAGLIGHLTRPADATRELARVVRPGGLLALFHPRGRAALASRHGRQLSEDDLRARSQLGPLLETAGWQLTGYTDEPDRYFVTAVRVRN